MQSQSNQEVNQNIREAMQTALEIERMCNKILDEQEESSKEKWKN